MFGNTPIGIIVLDVILVLMGAILTPLLWKIFGAISKGNESVRDVFEVMVQNSQSLAKICEELTESRIRDVEFKNTLQNLQSEIDRLRRKLGEGIS